MNPLSSPHYNLLQPIDWHRDISGHQSRVRPIRHPGGEIVEINQSKVQEEYGRAKVKSSGPFEVL